MKSFELKVEVNELMGHYLIELLEDGQKQALKNLEECVGDYSAIHYREHLWFFELLSDMIEQVDIEVSA